jgi:uncharacterized protein YkwD
MWQYVKYKVMKKILILLLLPIMSMQAQSVLEQEILVEINKVRQKHKREPIVGFALELQKAAQHHSTYLHLVNNKIRDDYYISHDEDEYISNYPKYSWEQRCSLMRENNARPCSEIVQLNGSANAKDIVDTYYNSPPHRALMIKQGVMVVGISNKGIATTVVFGN